MFVESSSCSSLSSRSNSTDDEYDAQMTPTQLLALAIKKRRSLYDCKERDFRRELLHTGMVKSLCKYLGEGRAKRRRSSRRTRRRSSSQKRKLTEPSSSQAMGPGSNGIQPIVQTPNCDDNVASSAANDSSAAQMDCSSPTTNILDAAPSAKRVKLDEDDGNGALKSSNFSHLDPFGLDAFFADLCAPSPSAFASSDNTFASCIEPSRDFGLEMSTSPQWALCSC